MFYIISRKTLLNFKYICKNDYLIENMNESDIECIYMTSIIPNQKLIREKLIVFYFLLFFSRLYHTITKPYGVICCCK